MKKTIPFIVLIIISLTACHSGTTTKTTEPFFTYFDNNSDKGEVTVMWRTTVYTSQIIYDAYEGVYSCIPNPSVSGLAKPEYYKFSFADNSALHGRHITAEDEVKTFASYIAALRNPNVKSDSVDFDKNYYISIETDTMHSVVHRRGHLIDSNGHNTSDYLIKFVHKKTA